VARPIRESCIPDLFWSASRPTILGSFIVEGTEPPEEGGANRAVIRILAAHFGVPQSQVRILSGFKSRSKVAEVVEGWRMPCLKGN
jgi:hypothetical protein